MLIEELWSQADERRAEELVRACDSMDLAGALFAIEGATDDLAEHDRERLDAWALHVRARAPGDPPGDAAALASVLGSELGFRGDVETYEHPRNSHLHQVMERRRGLPILLSAIWMEVGRRAGIQVDGIGLPGHFVVRVGGPGGVYADPFHSGRTLTEAEVRKIARDATGGAAFRPAWLAEATLPDLLERVLRNLSAAGRRAGDGPGLYRTASLLAALRPEVASVALERAQAARSLGAVDLARAHAEHVMRRFPGTPEAGAAREIASAPAPRVFH